MVKKSVIMINKGSVATNNVEFSKDNINMLFKLEGKTLKLLFLMINSKFLIWNNNTIYIDDDFYSLASDFLELKPSGVSLHCGKLVRNNILKKKKNGIYIYNPNLFFYGDDEYKYKKQAEWDKIKILSNTIKK